MKKATKLISLFLNAGDFKFVSNTVQEGFEYSINLTDIEKHRYYKIANMCTSIAKEFGYLSYKIKVSVNDKNYMIVDNVQELKDIEFESGKILLNILIRDVCTL